MSKIDDLIKELCPDGVDFKRLGAVCNKIKTGGQRNKSTLSKTRSSDNQYPVINGGISESGFTSEFNTPSNTITVSQGGASSGFVNYMTENFWAGAHCYVVSPSDESYLNNRYLYFILKNSQTLLMDRAVGAGIPGLNSRALNEYKIPVPPLEVQKEIVRVLDSFTELEAELEARKKQYKYYRNDLLIFSKSSNTVEQKLLSEVVRIKNGKDWKVAGEGNIPVYGSGGRMSMRVDRCMYNKPTVLLPRKGTISNVFYVEEPFWNVDTVYYTEIDADVIIPKYFFYFMDNFNLSKLDTGSGRPSLTHAVLNKIRIPIPPMSRQKQIVSILDKFEKLTNDISVGLPAEIEARRKQYEYYRNKLLTFKELECSR